MSEKDQPDIAMILVAAGRGRRLGGARPKQYVELGGRPVLRRSIDACLAPAEVSRMICVIHPDDAEMYREAVAGIGDARLGAPVYGADTRSGSVRAGLDALAGEAPDLVLIHDAARPFVSVDVIRRVIAALGHAPGAVAALPVVDALWRVEGGSADTPLPRDGLWRAQTPQGFRFDAICAAHLQVSGDHADDVAVARAAGLEVAVVEGEEANFKITSQADMTRAREVLRLDGNRG